MSSRADTKQERDLSSRVTESYPAKLWWYICEPASWGTFLHYIKGPDHDFLVSQAGIVIELVYSGIFSRKW